ncbi:MAG: acyltransferase [Desulfocapsaceae bacterium]|jgi:fucose 4-O-acetylase-like acetyltransferase|nr:acyltransferase [Desulfocapsaceae bacterium]
MRQRTDWVDYGKGIGIILVVYGHLLSSGYHAHLNIQEHFFALSDSIIYSFHMPFFFFLTGLFVEMSFQKRGAQKFFINKIKYIAYPYLIWSLLQTSAELFLANHTYRGITIKDILAIPYRPWSQFWFLYALICMYAAYCMFNKLGKFSTAAMTLSAIILFFYPIKTEIAALHDFSIEFLFFVSGILAKRHLADPKKHSIPSEVTLVLFIILMGSGYFIFNNQIEPVRLTNGSHPFYFLYLSTVGILFGLGFSQYLARKNCCRPIKYLGIHSLQIYLVHMLAGVGARIILSKLFHIQNPALHICIGVIAGLWAPIIIYKISLIIHFPYLFHLKEGRSTNEYPKTIE